MRMEELGQKFENRRQELEIELSTASEETNIRTDYLRDIEEGDFDQIEAEVYLKGFLKVYSNYLDLDTEAIMEEYKQLKSKEADSEVEPEEEKGQVKEKIKEFVDKHQNLLLGVFISGLILLLIVGVVYLGTVAYQQFTKHETGEKIQNYISNLTGNSSAEQSETSSQEPTDAKSSSPDETQSQVETEPAEEGATEQSETSKQSSSEKTNSKQEESATEKKSANQQTEADLDSKETKADEESVPKDSEQTEAGQTNQQQVQNSKQTIEIQIETVEESWYLVQVNGQEEFRGLVASDITKRFSGREIKVRIGNAAGVKIIKGEQTLGPFGEKGEIVTKVFSVQEAEEQE